MANQLYRVELNREYIRRGADVPPAEFCESHIEAQAIACRLSAFYSPTNPHLQHYVTIARVPHICEDGFGLSD